MGFGPIAWVSSPWAKRWVKGLRFGKIFHQHSAFTWLKKYSTLGFTTSFKEAVPFLEPLVCVCNTSQEPFGNALGVAPYKSLGLVAHTSHFPEEAMDQNPYVFEQTPRLSWTNITTSRMTSPFLSARKGPLLQQTKTNTQKKKQMASPHVALLAWSFGSLV